MKVVFGLKEDPRNRDRDSGTEGEAKPAKWLPAMSEFRPKKTFTVLVHETFSVMQHCSMYGGYATEPGRRPSQGRASGQCDKGISMNSLLHRDGRVWLAVSSAGYFDLALAN
ncbi:MAG TPA: hypothetical protein VIS76_11390 [Pseudomonadales bacterium]